MGSPALLSSAISTVAILNIIMRSTVRLADKFNRFTFLRVLNGVQTLADVIVNWSRPCRLIKRRAFDYAIKSLCVNCRFQVSFSCDRCRVHQRRVSVRRRVQRVYVRRYVRLVHCSNYFPFEMPSAACFLTWTRFIIRRARVFWSQRRRSEVTTEANYRGLENENGRQIH